MKSNLFAASVLLCLLAAPVAHAEGVSLTDGGIKIDYSKTGSNTINYPELLDSGGGPATKQLKVVKDGDAEVITYEDGSTTRFTLDGNRGVSMTFDKLGANVVRFKFAMNINFVLAHAGTWKMGTDAPKPFPADQPTNANFFQGNVQDFQYSDLQGAFNIKAPAYSYQQLTDCREWGWKNIAWSCFINADRNNPHIQLGIGIGEKKAPVIQVDKWGQPTAMMFPGKITSDDQLKQDLAAELAAGAGVQPAGRDIYGGLDGTGAKMGLKKTGYFHVEKHAGRWTMADPLGNAFFQVGVCGTSTGDDFTKVGGREEIYAWLPDANGEFKTAFRPWSNGTEFSYFVANNIKKYSKPYDDNSFAVRMIDRLQSWGFNSGGPFCGMTPAYHDKNFTYASILPMWDNIVYIPGANGAWDPFDEKNRVQLDKNFARDLPGAANDPLRIGYFYANEPDFEDIPRVVPRLDSKFACKRQLVTQLKATYPTIAGFNTAWGVEAKSFDELADMTLPVTTAEARTDMKKYTGTFYEAMFKYAADTFHKYDKNHMLLGNRFQSGTINNEQMCRIMGKYVDVMSFNYYTCGIDKSFMNRIYEWTGRPMILSEFYFTSTATTGLLGGSMDFKTQRERGLAYRDYVEHAAATGFVVGTIWFANIDQAATGRYFEGYSGESANAGLVSVTDRPYTEALNEMKVTNASVLDVASGKRAPYALADPRFTVSAHTTRNYTIPRAAGHVAMDGTTTGFAGNPMETIAGARLAMGADAIGFDGAFKLCYDDQNLYLLMNVSDPTPMKNNHTGDSLWAADGIEFFMGPETNADGAPIPSDRQVLLSAGSVNGKFDTFVGNSLKHDGCSTVVTPRVDGTGYVLEACIPFKVLGFTPKPGETVKFDVAIDDSPDGNRRIRQLVWNGSDRNSGDRSLWGTALFMK